MIQFFVLAALVIFMIGCLGGLMQLMWLMFWLVWWSIDATSAAYCYDRLEVWWICLWDRTVRKSQK